MDKSGIVVSCIIFGFLVVGGCSSGKEGSTTSVHRKGWHQIEMRSCEAKDLGEGADLLRAAILKGVIPLQTERQRIRRTFGEEPKYDLAKVTYLVGTIRGKTCLVAVGAFLEDGVTQVSERDAQVTAILWQGRVHLVNVSGNQFGLGSGDPVQLWQPNEDGFIRIILAELATTRCQTTGTSITVHDIDLQNEEITSPVQIGTSEHSSLKAARLDIDVLSGNMVLTATHPDDANDPLAEVEAGGSRPEVKVEQLRRACVRVTLPNPF